MTVPEEIDYEARWQAILAQGCGVCGEGLDEKHDQLAEMYDPKKPELDSVVCHAECGIQAGLEVA